jgi:hypothetical protein
LPELWRKDSRIGSTAAPELFVGPLLCNDLALATQHAVDMLMNWPPDEILNGAEADMADSLVRLATFKVPQLDRNNAYLESPTEITMPGERVGQTVRTVYLTRFTLVVPFTGHPPLFNRTASRRSAEPVYGEVDELYYNLRLYCDGLHDPVQVKASFEIQLDKIEKKLSWTQAEVEGHNQQMARQLPEILAQRRAKLLADRNIQASIGYAIKRRPDADNHAVPVRRKGVTPAGRTDKGASTNPFTPEPALIEEDYEAALAVLRNARNALERSPSMSAKLDEEEIRDLLLVTLNAQFEGKAGAEVFNCAGKTDILIREGDRNVFIGECKIFDPRNKQSVDHVVTDALSQLLSYLVWRDTKAAMLLFVRDADVSIVTDKALEAIRNHRNYKRPGKIDSEERHDFVIHADGDINREIHLAFLPFLIGTRKT